MRLILTLLDKAQYRSRYEAKIRKVKIQNILSFSLLGKTSNFQSLLLNCEEKTAFKFSFLDTNTIEQEIPGVWGKLRDQCF